MPYELQKTATTSNHYLKIKQSTISKISSNLRKKKFIIYFTTRKITSGYTPMHENVTLKNHTKSTMYTYRHDLIKPRDFFANSLQKAKRLEQGIQLKLQKPKDGPKL